MKLIDIINRSCTNKKAFNLKKADQIVTSYLERKELMFYYKCPICKSYHLTKNEPSKKTERYLTERVI